MAIYLQKNNSVKWYCLPVKAERAIEALLESYPNCVASDSGDGFTVEVVDSGIRSCNSCKFSDETEYCKSCRDGSRYFAKDGDKHDCCN